MRQALARNARRAAVAKPYPVLAPVKGLITALDETDLPDGSAIVLDNWFPDLDNVRARRGCANFATMLGGAVESLMTFRGGAAERLFAAANGKILDVTTGAPVVAVSGLTSTRFQHLNFVTSGGQWLHVFNGVDAPRVFNGTAWTTPAFTFPVSVADTASDLVGGCSYKERLFLIAEGSSSVYYLPVDSFQGTLSNIEVGGELVKGGYVMAIGRWTTDAGEGPGDYLAIVSSEGEIIVYSGTSPDDLDTWNLSGRYTIARPIGRRCLVHSGADLGILTTDGLISMARLTTISEADQSTKGAFTGNIAPSIHDAVADHGTGFGWEVSTYTERQMLILNAPTVGAYSEQYVMNITTGAWAHWTGMHALCWGVFQDKLYFGLADGRVAQADTGTGDFGQSIIGTLVGAFQPYGSRTQQKRCTLMRAILQATTNVQPAVGVCVDYDIRLQPSIPSTGTDRTARWGTALWGIDVWSGKGPGSTRKVWASVSGVGSVFAPTLTYTSDPTQSDAETDLRVLGFDIVLEAGNVL